VSVFTVSKELGHTSRDMVTRVYGHLGDVQHRGEVVEYRLPTAKGIGTPGRARAL